MKEFALPLLAMTSDSHEQGNLFEQLTNATGAVPFALFPVHGGADALAAAQLLPVHATAHVRTARLSSGEVQASETWSQSLERVTAHGDSMLPVPGQATAAP